MTRWWGWGGGRGERVGEGERVGRGRSRLRSKR